LRTEQFKLALMLMAHANPAAEARETSLLPARATDVSCRPAGQAGGHDWRI
jgi:hypothetical protein